MKEASSKRSSRAQPHLNLCNVRRQGDTLCAAKALASEPAKPILACLVWGDPSPTGALDVVFQDYWLQQILLVPKFSCAAPTTQLTVPTVRSMDIQ